MFGQAGGVRVDRVLEVLIGVTLALGGALTPVSADLVGVDPVAEHVTEAVLGGGPALKELVVSSLGEGNPGARAYFQRRAARDLSLQDVEGLALGRNLDVKVQRLRVRQSEQGIIGADSGFDPSLNYSVNFDVSRSLERVETFTRIHEKVIDFDKLEDDFRIIANGGVPTPAEPCVIVDGELVNGIGSGANPPCDGNLELSPVKDFASFESDYLSRWGLAVDASKSFFWGGNVSVGLSSEYVRRLGTSFGLFDAPLSVDNPLGTGSRYAWASALSLAVSVPLPYSKDFGEWGFRPSVDVKQALEAYEQSQWVYGRTTNDVVRDAHRLYWGVVNAILQLRTAIRHRETLEELYQGAKRRFDQRQITQYELVQSEADLENIRNVEEQAWDAYLTASNALVELLDLGRDVYVVPARHVEDLQRSHEVDVATALETSYQRRPELKVAESVVNASDNELRHAKEQTRPDVFLSASYALSQDNSILGYRDPVHSLENIFRPDKDDFFVGLFYRYPFGNVAVKKRLSEARIRRTQSTDNRERTRIRITQDVNSAAADVLSAESQTRLTRTNLRLAELAYDRGKRLRENGLITEFELLEVFDALLDARNAHILAKTAYQAFYAQFAWAQGLLAERYETRAE